MNSSPHPCLTACTHYCITVQLLFISASLHHCINATMYQCISTTRHLPCCVTASLYVYQCVSASALHYIRHCHHCISVLQSVHYVSISLHYCFIASLHMRHCITVLLHQCINAPLDHSISASVHQSVYIVESVHHRAYITESSHQCYYCISTSKIIILCQCITILHYSQCFTASLCHCNDQYFSASHSISVSVHYCQVHHYNNIITAYTS